MASGFFVLSLITQQSHRSVRLPPGGAGGRRLRGRGGRPQADGNLVTGNLYASKILTYVTTYAILNPRGDSYDGYQCNEGKAEYLSAAE